MRKWLAATFASPEQVKDKKIFFFSLESKGENPQTVKSKEARPTLRSVAQAIRTGIFIEKIYQRMSKTQMMEIPEEVGAHLEVS